MPAVTAPLSARTLRTPRERPEGPLSARSYLPEPKHMELGTGFLAPHPRSGIRQKVQANPEVMAASGHEVWAHRAKGCWAPSASSKTCVTTARAAEAMDYRSHWNLTVDRRKHVRTNNGPQRKFLEPVATSHEVGWLQNDLTYAEGNTCWLAPPMAPVRSSAMTKYKDNMELTRSYHVLRK